MKIRKTVPPCTAYEAGTSDRFCIKCGGAEDRHAVAEQTINAAEAKPGARYLTFSRNSIFGNARTPVEFVGFNPAGDVVLKCWYENLQTWSSVPVPRTYKLIPLKEEKKMKIGTTVEKPAKNTNPKTFADIPVEAAPANSRLAVGKTTKKDVWETWGIAFQKYGTKADAEKHIAEFMEEEFPGRKTQFSKWVNNVRIRYNNGKLGVPAPTEPIPVYKVAPKAKAKAKAAAKPKAKAKAKR